MTKRFTHEANFLRKVGTSNGQENDHPRCNPLGSRVFHPEWVQLSPGISPSEQPFCAVLGNLRMYIEPDIGSLDDPELDLREHRQPPWHLCTGVRRKF